MEILYHDIVTASGQPADVVISALPTFIRRGETEQAARAAYELYLVGEEMTEYLWQRLKIISAEDIGLGQPVAPVVVEALWSISRRFPRDTSDYTLLFIHAVRYLCACRKERGSSLLSSVTKRRIRDGEAFDLPDYIFDRHTIEGQRLGRGIEHFLTESAKVAPEADLGPDEALWRQAMEQELAERMKEEDEE